MKLHIKMLLLNLNFNILLLCFILYLGDFCFKNDLARVAFLHLLQDLLCKLEHTFFFAMLQLVAITGTVSLSVSSVIEDLWKTNCCKLTVVSRTEI